MKQTFKKAMSLLLVAVMLFGAVAITNGFDFANIGIRAEAATKYTSGYYTYTVTNGKAETVDFDTSVVGNITIPSTLDGYPVTSIGDNTFWGCENLTGVVIPNSVEKIGVRAFLNCNNLTYITIPDSVTFIGERAFDGCESLVSIKLPNNLTNISDSVFIECSSLTAVTIPNKVTSIGNSAFQWCSSLAKVTLPENITVIGESAFSECSSLVKINIPDSVVNINNYAFAGCTSLSNITVPDSVLSIGNRAFVGCTSLVKFVIPKNMTVLSNGLFAGCTSLSEITIHDSILTIGESVFSGCDALTDIEIPNSVLSMGDFVFSDCDGLTSITIPDSITSIGESVFWDCNNLKSIVIPNTVTSIGSYSFDYECDALTDVYYTGTEEQWNEIAISENNDALLNATIHYNYDASHRHSYTSSVTTAATCTKAGVKTFLCGCGDSYTETIPATGHQAGSWQTVTAATTEKEGKKVKKCIVCSTVIEEQAIAKLEKVEPTTKPAPVEEEIIKKPSTTTVNYGETLILHADFTNIPADAKIEWSVEGEGVTINPSEDGKTCAVTSTATGDATITAKYVDANGVEHVSEQEIESNASIWQKIVSFFKNLFGISRIIEQRIRF